ncbi:hypothetical protein C7B76_11300 [filamentous cyanobacterium CCP2]|nr:hypothetical protein C7B76_11300 [filamentous cyanobacterium CCP2]
MQLKRLKIRSVRRRVKYDWQWLCWQPMILPFNIRNSYEYSYDLDLLQIDLRKSVALAKINFKKLVLLVCKRANA